MRYDRFGQGAPLIVLLPHSSGPIGVRGLLQQLSEQHDIIHMYPDSAPGVPPPKLLEAFAGQIAELSLKLQLGPAHVLCHSTGCGIGQLLAAGFPGVIRRLVLATPWTHADAHLYAMQTLRKASAYALDPEQYSVFNSAMLFPPEYRRAHAREFANMAQRARHSPHDPSGIARRLDAILALDTRVLWPRIVCPVLVLVAPDDQLMPSWFGRETADALREAELCELDGGGHMILETRANAVAKSVLAFLGRA